MFSRNDVYRSMAAKYLRLARDTEDPLERSKCIDYAMIYAQLADQTEHREEQEPRHPLTA